MSDLLKSDTEDNKSDDSKQVVKMVIRKKVATTPISILIESLVRNLCTMIERDEKRAMKIYNIICSKLYEMKLIDESYHMTEFEGIRGQYEKALYRLVMAARGGEELSSSVELGVWPHDQLPSEWSHYVQEFEEVAFIAGGGFGQVFRVRHKLDGLEYAVKKIYIRSNDIKSIMNYLDEVKTYAGLNHPNVVQYKAAWLELGMSNTKNALKPAESSSEKSSYPSRLRARNSFRTRQKSSSNFTIEFQHSKIYSHSSENLSSDKWQESRNSISEGGKAICRVSTEDIMQELTNPQHNWATLYIQMSLCQRTLKSWLEMRNSMTIGDFGELSHRLTVLEILRQLLQGLQYIHSKGIVHHDVKPSNIFIQIEDSGSLCVQLGDFGLACPLRGTSHGIALGTKLYAAPEQLQGKCDPRSDMYSVGIVLLELIETFRTDMERARCVSELRKGRLPAHLPANEPQVAQIIAQLVAWDPNQRPEAYQLLEELNTRPEDSPVVSQLRTQLAEKDLEISRLKNMLRAAGVDV